MIFDHEEGQIACIKEKSEKYKEKKKILKTTTTKIYKEKIKFKI